MKCGGRRRVVKIRFAVFLDVLYKWFYQTDFAYEKTLSCFRQFPYLYVKINTTAQYTSEDRQIDNDKPTPLQTTIIELVQWILAELLLDT